jgi:hypothetical protein
MMIQALLFNRSHYLGVSQYSDLGISQRLPAKAKACDVRANAAFRISTLHRRCLYDVI